MRIDFTKMHGLGNDFIVIDAPADGALPTAAQWRALANRHTGIGFDQALVLQPPRRAATAVYYRIFNADGGEVEQCGNGARCIAALLHRRSPDGPREFTMDSTGGLVGARILGPELVSINMGVPDFDPHALPFETHAPAAEYREEFGGEVVQFGAVSMGNPHAVIRVTAVESAPVEHVGRLLQASPRFPRQVNVGFLQVLDAGHVRLRVYERGAGETLACGTGACAAVAVGRSLGLLGEQVEVHVPGGKLGVHWQGPGQPVWLTGPASIAFVGSAQI
jgi:diaminopimelate epimerase